MKKVLIAFLLLIILGCAKVEIIKSTEDIEIAYSMAMEAYTRQDYKEAKDLFLFIANNAREREVKAKSLFYLGEIYKALGEFGASLLSYAMASYYEIDCAENIKEVAPTADVKSLEKAVNYAPLDTRPYLLYIAARKYQIDGKEKESSELFLRIIREYPNTVYAREAKYLQKAKGEFKVGVLLPLSGVYSDIGVSVKRGIEIASRDKFIPIYSDIKGNPLLSYKEVIRLIEREEVSGIIGPLLSINSFAVACLTDYLGVPMVSPTATQEIIDSVGNMTYIINRSLSMQASAMADYAINELGIRSFAILYPAVEYGETLYKNFKEAVERLGGNIIVSVAYKEGDTDFKDEVRTINQNMPEALYIPALTPDIPLLAPQLKYYKVKAQILGADGWKAEELFSRIETSSLDGVVITDHPYNPTKVFIDRFDYVYREYPDRYACLGYDAANLMAYIINNPRKNPSRANITFLAGNLGDEESYSAVPFYIINNGEFRPVE